MEVADSVLIERARAGEVEAFEALVQRYHRSCLRFALRMMSDLADAEEAVQDAFVRAYRALPRYDHRDRFGPWLFRILVNRCRTMLANRKRTREALEGLEWHFSSGLVPAPEVEEGWSVEVQQALMALPQPLREALLLRYVEEQSYEEIAAATGAGVSAVKMRVKRARDRLRCQLEQIYHG